MLDPSLYKYIPALEPPPGVTPNFTNPESKRALIIIIGSFLMGTMVFFYAARVYAKHFISREYTWDDLTCAISFIGSITYFSVVLWGCTNGPVGIHQWDLHLDKIFTKNFIIPSYLIVILTPPIMMFVKLTFFLLYLHIFRRNTIIKFCIYIGMLLTTIFYTGVATTQLVLATPPPGKTWLEYYLSPRASKTDILSIPTVAVALGIDLYILILPIGGVIKLQMPTRRKIGVCLIFLTGTLACIASLLSIYYRSITKRSKDLTWNLLNVELVACVEMFIGVICACMPFVSKILHHHSSQFEKSKTVFSSLFGGLRSTFYRIRDKVTDSDAVSSQNKIFYKNHDFVPLENVAVSTVTSRSEHFAAVEEVTHS